MMTYRHIIPSLVGEVLVIRVRETELRDYDLSRQLAGEMVAAVNESEPADVVLDLEEVLVMTSAAILSLFSLRTCVKQRGGELVLCNLTEIVAQSLAVSKLIGERRSSGSFLQLAVDRPAALAMFNSKSDTEPAVEVS